MKLIIMGVEVNDDGIEGDGDRMEGENYISDCHFEMQDRESDPDYDVKSSKDDKLSCLFDYENKVDVNEELVDNEVQVGVSQYVCHMDST